MAGCGEAALALGEGVAMEAGGAMAVRADELAGPRGGWLEGSRSSLFLCGWRHERGRGRDREEGVAAQGRRVGCGLGLELVGAPTGLWA